MHLHARGNASGVAQSIVGRIATTTAIDGDRRDHVWLAREAGLECPKGFSAILSIPEQAGVPHPSIAGVPTLSYLTDGDVVALHPSGMVQVLYRRSSRHNTFLVTERCNSLCLMCSQPPRDEDDSWRVPIILRALELIDPECQELGLTGGEPTLLGDHFFAIVGKAKQRLPSTALHVLTNGRLFADRRLASRLGALEHPDLMLGIPLYSDVDGEHDYVVQVAGAYDETLQGLHNLAEAGVPIELRIVVHGATYQRLPHLAEFIARNLPFVSHVAFMGLEMFGYVHLNLDAIWIDPSAYQHELECATQTLALHGIEAVIFNHQLCVLKPSLWPFAVRSISDWKNVYLPECDSCLVRARCGGFFQSGTKRHSTAIRPILTQEMPV